MLSVCLLPPVCFMFFYPPPIPFPFPISISPFSDFLLCPISPFHLSPFPPFPLHPSPFPISHFQNPVLLSLLYRLPLPFTLRPKLSTSIPMSKHVHPLWKCLYFLTLPSQTTSGQIQSIVDQCRAVPESAYASIPDRHFGDP